MTHPNPRLLTDEISAVLVSETGKEIGVGEAPPTTTRPYAVVYPLGIFSVEPGLRSQNQTQRLEWQITCVGDTVEQAEWMMNEVRNALLDTGPSNPTGYVFTGEALLVPVQAVERDDDVQPPLYYGIDIYRWTVTPQ